MTTNCFTILRKFQYEIDITRTSHTGKMYPKCEIPYALKKNYKHMKTDSYLAYSLLVLSMFLLQNLRKNTEQV